MPASGGAAALYKDTSAEALPYSERVLTAGYAAADSSDASVKWMCHAARVHKFRAVAYNYRCVSSAASRLNFVHGFACCSEQSASELPWRPPCTCMHQSYCMHVREPHEHVHTTHQLPRWPGASPVMQLLVSDRVQSPGAVGASLSHHPAPSTRPETLLTSTRQCWPLQPSSQKHRSSLSASPWVPTP